MSYTSGSPPPGPPNGTPPNGTPSDKPVKKAKGIRATLYRAKTHLRRASLGKEKIVKTEVVEKKKKKGKGNQGQPAPAPAPVVVHTQEVITHYVPVPVPVMPGMPAPVTQQDINYQAYILQQQFGSVAPTVPNAPQPPVQYLTPAQMPAHVVTTTQQQHPFIASQLATPHLLPQPSFQLSASQPANKPSGSQPAKVDDWNTRASTCMSDLLESLDDRDQKKIDRSFGKMRNVAREQKFADDTINGWISSAGRIYARVALRQIYESAIEQLPAQNLMADSVRRGIARILAPLELINAIKEGRSEKAWEFADVVRNSCDPNKWGDEKPDEKQARDMMQSMLDTVLANFSDKELYELDLAVRSETTPQHPAIYALEILMRFKYLDRIVSYKNAHDL